MSQFRSVLIAVGTLAPLLAIYGILLWLSRQRRPDNDDADSPPTAAGAAAVPWVAAPPPAVRRRVRAALARLTVAAASPAEGGSTQIGTAAGGKAAHEVDEEAPVDTDALCVICLDGWDDLPAVAGRDGVRGEGGGGADKGGGGGGNGATAARTRLPCGHAFHPSCILRWAVKAPRCPLCNDGALAAAAAAAAGMEVDAVVPDDGAAASLPPPLESHTAAGLGTGGGAPDALRGHVHQPLGTLHASERMAVVSLAA